MISYLKGKLFEKKPTEIIIETNSVGFSLNISLKTYEFLPDVNEIVSLYTILIPREDSLNLYGFATQTEKELFKLLTSVNGIGPKSAIGILSAIEAKELIQMVLGGNSFSLQKFPGIGKKTADRIILELKDKVAKVLGTEEINNVFPYINNKNEAVEALIILGYNRIASEKITKEILQSNPDISTEEIIKLALSKLMK